MNIERQKERQVEYLRREVSDLKDMIIRLSQQMPMAMMTASGMGGGDGAGGFYSDPGATTIAAGASASLTVVEVKASGDVTVGTRTVINRYHAATDANKRLILEKCSDDAYLIVGQDCLTGGG